MWRLTQRLCWVASVSLLFAAPLVGQNQKKQKPPATTPAKKKPAVKPAPPAQQAAAPATPVEPQPPKRTYADKPRLREQWFYEQRAFPRKQIPAGAHARAIARLEEMRRAERERRAQISAAQAIMASQTMWTNIGPQPSDSGPDQFEFGFTSGRIGALAVDPTNPNIVYVGGAQGGIWKTTNGGTNWTPLTDSQASLAVGAIAIDPTSCTPGPCQTIYVGTGEQTFSSSSYYGAGVLKSTDAGMTWTQLGTPPGAPFVGPFNTAVGGARIGAVAVNSSSPNILLAGVQIFLSVDTGTSSGIYRSTDGGMTWTNVLPGAAGTEVFFHPSNPMIAYAALGSLDGDPQNGVYRSTDMGMTWARMGSAGFPSTGFPTANLGRIEIAISSSNANVLYASVADSSAASDNLIGVFRTSDAGATWVNTNAPNFCAGQCWYDQVIRVHPADPAVAYAGGAATDGTQTGFSSGRYFVRTTNGTSASPTWTGVALGANGQRIHVDIHAISFGTGGGVTRMYNGNDGGVWSADVTNPTGPINWTNLNNNLSLTQHYPALSIHPSNENIGVVGSQDNDTHRYTGSLQWQQIGPGCDGGWTVIDPAVPSTWFITCQFVTIFRSVQNGERTSQNFLIDFAFADSGIDFIDPVAFIPPFVGDPQISGRLYFGTNRVYQTNNSGDSWLPISPDLTGGSGTLRAIAVAPSDSNRVITGSSTGRIARTFSAGGGTSASWEVFTPPELPTRVVTQVAISPAIPNHVYVTFSGFGSCPAFGGSPACDGKGHVFRSINGGGTWTDISIAPFSTTPLPDSPVNDIVVDPLDPTGDTLYVGTDVGVFFTMDGGANWATLVTGLPRVAVFSLRLHSTSRVLRAATHGRGTWDLQLPGLPAFHLRSISPVTTPTGSPDVLVTLLGDGFSSASLVQFGMAQFSPIIVSPNELRVTIPAAQFAAAQVVAIRVVDPNQAPNTTTNSLPFTVTGPAPVLFSISPASAPEGSGPVEITAMGTNFVSGISFLRFDGVDFAATVDSSAQLRATIPANQLATGRIVSVNVFNAPPGGGTTIPATFTVVGPPPPNDNFANAIVITGNTFNDTQNTTGATTEPNDPNPSTIAACPGAGRNFSIWYRFTPTSNVAVVVDTGGSSYDTVLSVWTGAALGSLTAVACNDDGLAPAGPSILNLNLIANTTYHFMVTGFSSTDAGTARFNFALAIPPPNDNFANATVAGAVPFTNTVNSAFATTPATDPTPACAFPGAALSGRAKSIWYRYTASASGMVTADTFGSSVFDTILSVWTGSSGALTAAACNDDDGSGGTGLQSRVMFNAVANTTYHFMVTDWDGLGGGTTFNITMAPAPGPDISLSPAQGTLTVTRGQSASTMISVSAFAGFNGSVALSCTGAPSLATCTASPASVTPGAMPASSTLTVTTTAGSVAPSASASPAVPLPGSPWLVVFGLCCGLFLAVRSSRRFRFAGVALVFVLLLLALQVACGGGGGGGGGNPPPPQPGTPPGTYTLTVTGTSGALSRSTTITLTVN
jgi:photosystem II stability/assembly factor-like uncharacterized protein